MPIPKEILDEIALSEQEYRSIVDRMRREPNAVELGMFGALWSEHCGYKHSKQLLRLFPVESPDLLVAPGNENAGAVDIGHGLAAIFKMESHNHPSAIEPYQGAATGVGGIVRDILAMGGRPIALLNSLRFGPLVEAHNRFLFDGVVGGISGYGNCIGVPNVGGEIAFSQSYSGNPLVNALCLGIVPSNMLVRSAARTPGNLLVLVGSETGRDGIHGASGLASRTFEDNREQRPAVQMGNPFLEKVLIEACLETAEANLIEGMQDLGAAGLTSSIVESAAKGGTGFDLDVSRVPRRETEMTPYEIMLSESQERMLLIVPPTNLARVEAIFDKWDTPCNVIGKVTNDGMARVTDGAMEVAAIPVYMLTHPPMYTVDGEKPEYLEKLQQFDMDSIPLPQQQPGEVLLKLLASPNIASKESVYQQYDHQVGTNTVVGPGNGDAAVLWIKGTNKAIALSTDGNGRLCYLNPHSGGAIAVAEACRNLVCTGARPVAITDCLNFGNPEKQEVAFQLPQAVHGMVRACQELNVPVVSGNVSLYNESRGNAIYPTPTVGALGVLDDIGSICTSSFKEEGDIVFLLGATDLSGHPRDLAGSEFLEVIHGLVTGNPTIDLQMEARLQSCCLRLIKTGLLRSAHDCSDGGLAIALAESAIQGQVGFRGSFDVAGRWDATLFSEKQSRIVVSFNPQSQSQVEQICVEEQIPCVKLGTVGGTRFVIAKAVDLVVSELANAWHNGLQEPWNSRPKAGI
ncbi:MAG: phosphoribosylformylglycinamidine synthase subunit PurL [Chloroflexota bacterium]|nr:phosphoribosylformylglycinamidine synthase subunit PurL [Chloroflexota bacterium]